MKMEVLKVLEKHHIDPTNIINIMNQHPMQADIIDQQEKIVLADIVMTTPAPEYSTIADGEVIEDTLVENNFASGKTIFFMKKIKTVKDFLDIKISFKPF